MCASSPRCATPSISNISASCWKTRPTIWDRTSSRRPRFSTSSVSSGGSPPSPISAAPFRKPLPPKPERAIMPKTAVIPPGTTAPLAPYSPGTMADGVVYVSGTLPFDKQNNVVHVGDAAAQTRHVLETIKSVIETAGGTMADVTFNSIFITDWANYAAINQVYAEYFPGDKPARFCIQCGLVKPDALVEIATIAHIGKP